MVEKLVVVCADKTKFQRARYLRKLTMLMNRHEARELFLVLRANEEPNSNRIRL